MVELGPVAGTADQPLQRGARFDERPDHAVAHLEVGERLLLPLDRIGGKQIVERCGNRGARSFAAHLRLAAREEMLAEAVAAHELGAGLADLFQMLQAAREIGGKIRGRRLIGLGRFGQKQPRFQIRKPGRHHQIVGSELDAQIARALDEGKILVGQRQDRDFREIDLLGAREREQKIERALESGHIDDQRLLAGGKLDGLQLESGRFGFHGDSASQAAIIAEKRARASATSTLLGLVFRRESAALARLSAFP